MASILTNNGAMDALQTLKGVNSNLETTQNEIATGKKVATAKDNAAVWAISKVMESDVKGFKGIKESLSLGESTVAVARQASETMTDLLTEMKGKIVAAQEDNVDRGKIQTDIEQLREQISSVVSSAQFNGLNLIDGNATDPVNILASLDRAADGTVNSSAIEVRTQDFTTAAQVVDTDDGTFAAGDATTGAASQTLDDGNATGTFAIAGVEEGMAFSLSIDSDVGDNAGGTLADAADIAYVARGGDTATDVARGLEAAFNAWAADNDGGGLEVSVNASGELVAARADLGATEDIAISVDSVVSDDNAAAGGLFALAGMDVSTAEGAQRALNDIEDLIQFGIDASASFGSAQARIEIQSDFVSQLTDSLITGIGTLVDADMEETSARLQSLQVQQQLAVQSLSIANQAPQNILSLFR